MTVEQFEFRFAPHVRRWNRLFGIGPTSSEVRLDGEDVTITFGRWAVHTQRSNVAELTTTGPYKTWRVAGPPRMSLADLGLTFGTNTDVGLCIAFHERVPGLDPFHLIRHPTLTVTVAEPEQLAAALGATEPPKHADLTHGSLRGSLRAVRRWAKRKRSVDVQLPRTVPSVDVPGDVAEADAQPLDSGVGPLFHRTYRVEVVGSSMSAEEVVSRIRADPNVIADATMAPFVKEFDHSGCAVVGDRFVVQTAGPWSGPVEVVDVGPDHLRLATLSGHMEAGLVEMRARDEDPLLVFEIESWARSGDRAFDVLYEKVGVAKAMQSEMWVSACEAVVQFSEGEQIGAVTITEEQVHDAG